MGVPSFLKTAFLAIVILYISIFSAICSAHGQGTLSRDICIVGGGSAGTYTAIRLLDMGKSVIVVESKDHLGGNTETFIDPVTGTPINIGVVVWYNETLVTNYFARLNVPLTPVSFSNSQSVTKFADFTTGILIPDFVPPDPSSALQIYIAQLLQYPFLNIGFNLPDPVPSDLLLPFGDFVNKYNIGPAVHSILQVAQGIGNLLEVPTIYVMKSFGLGVVQGIQNGFLATASHDNSQLYRNAQAVLTAADALLLNSRVVSTKRDSTGARIVVSTPRGDEKIDCRKIVLAIPPTIQNYVHFDFNETELALFRQFSATGYYTGLIRNSGIPDTTTIENIGANTPFNVLTLPGVYSFFPTGVPGLHQVLYASVSPLPVEKVKHDIIDALKRLQATGIIAPSEPEFAVFSSHAPFQFTVSSNAIANGFYSKLNSIQGQRSLFFTGAAFDAQDSSSIWQFTEALLPRIVA